MWKDVFRSIACLTLLTLGVLFVGGCGQSDGEGDDTKARPNQVSDDEKQHDHSGWWCKEHGIPEEVCSMCSSKAATSFKAQGDWCEKHDRAQSQCFICNPDLKDKFAAKYEAKFGKKPPEPTE